MASDAVRDDTTRVASCAWRERLSQIKARGPAVIIDCVDAHPYNVMFASRRGSSIAQAAWLDSKLLHIGARFARFFGG